MLQPDDGLPLGPRNFLAEAESNSGGSRFSELNS